MAKREQKYLFGICLKKEQKPEASFIILSIRNSVSDSHQDNADLDPQIRTGPFGSGSGSGSDPSL